MRNEETFNVSLSSDTVKEAKAEEEMVRPYKCVYYKCERSKFLPS